ncbi:hypothetical protein C2G38_2213607 [Gigaspora rosea]|uniref:Uncharacterized protein n=1 Tax=Gigaspora rosea TaxID=44941 RepID=A0A397UK32_9GLOM|nr:hypothetical protein C2G38_2213607 [Gigaspora rosea]
MCPTIDTSKKTLAKNILNENINAKNSKLSGPLLFGLQYKSVEAVCKTLPSNEILREFVEEEKENFFHPNDSIVLKQAKFEINNCTYNINYGKIDKQLVKQQTQAIPITKEANITDPIIVSNVVTSIGKGRHRRITDILNYIIPFKKAKNVMLTVALLNSLDKLHKPKSHYMLVLFPGTENYYTLQNALAPLISDLQFLSEHRFYEIGG